MDYYEDMERLLAALREVNEDVDFEASERLVDDGVLDSMDVLAIISALEETFCVRVKPADVGPENFNSVRAIMDTVNRCRATLCQLK